MARRIPDAAEMRARIVARIPERFRKFIPEPAPRTEAPPGSYKSDVKWAVSLLLLTILGLSGAYHPAWQRAPAGREDLGDLVNTFLAADQLVFLLQLLGVLLVGALIGAIVLAFRDRPMTADEGLEEREVR